MFAPVRMLLAIPMFMIVGPITTVPVLISKTVMPILANLFKKRQQLLFFLITQNIKEGMIGMLRITGLCLHFSGIGQCNVHSPAVLTVALAGDQSRGFQFLDDLTGGTGLNSQLRRQLPLGHTSRLAENLENTILAALTIETAMSHAAQSA